MALAVILWCRMGEVGGPNPAFSGDLAAAGEPRLGRENIHLPFRSVMTTFPSTIYIEYGVIATACSEY